MSEEWGDLTLVEIQIQIFYSDLETVKVKLRKNSDSDPLQQPKRLSEH
jgi:hypothetical protein